MNIEEQMLEVMQNMGKKHSDEIGKGIDTVFDNLTKKLMVPKDALGISNESAEKIYAQAFQLYNMGKYEDSQKLFATLILLNVMEPKYMLGLAACAHMMKNYEEATKHYLKCGMMDSDSPIPFYHASDCFIKLDDIYSAMICLQTVIQRAGEKTEYLTMKNRSEVTLNTFKDKLKSGDLSIKKEGETSLEGTPELEK